MEEATVNSRGLIWDLVTKTLVFKLKKSESVNPDSEDDAPRLSAFKVNILGRLDGTSAGISHCLLE